MSDKIVKKVEKLPQLTAVKRTDKLIRRVAAYARVSTDKEEQQTSIVAQMEGKIDIMLTKSISRFGRNTVDTLTAIRELKSKGSFAYSRVLGLDKGKGKFEIVVNREEAVIICKIFRMFLQGLTPHTIAIALTAAGIFSPGGCEVWSAATVRRMLSNGKYKGDMLLQKKFTVDFLTKKVKINEDELPQYYVSNNHEPIIDPWLFDFVQENFTSRKRENKHRYSGVNFFSSKIICAKCGAIFSPRPRHSTSYNNSVWQCRNRYSAVKCKTTNIYDKLLFYVLHDVARKKIVAKDIRTAIVE